MAKLLILIFLTAIFQSRAYPDLYLTPKVTETTGDNSFRLPNVVTPINYFIKLIIPEETLNGTGSTTFTGVVDITFSIAAGQTINNILLHSLVNNIQPTLRSTDPSSSIIIPTTIGTFNPTTEIISININDPLGLGEGSYTLTLTYDGTIETTSMVGLYRSHYKAITGETEYLLTTQFEPTHARRVFPCFDEPSFRATYDLTITHPTSYTVKSNTPGTSVRNTDGTTVTTFTTTPEMPTYLLAFTISKFTCTEISESTSYSICSRQGSEYDRTFALNNAHNLLNQLNVWTAKSYNTLSTSISKIDQIAVPDFMAGAMENWGLVTYRESLLLYNQLFASNRQKQGILSVMAHEFAHMWFGNYVTIDWWNNLFLSEAFATYFEYFLFPQIPEFSSYEFDKQFLIDHHQRALIADGYVSSPSLTSDAFSPREIWNKFNAISYSKGACVLKMIENLLSTTNFQNGVRQYLGTASRTVTPNDLWTALEQSSPTNQNLPVSIRDFINSWVNAAGYPVVKVTLNGNNIDLTQERFLYEGTQGSDSTASSPKWYIPIDYKVIQTTSTGTITPTPTWIQATDTLPLPNIINNNNNNNEAFIVSHDTNGYLGYFRVHYDVPLRERIIAILENNHLLLSDIDRAQIVDDSLNLARSGHYNYSDAFQMINYLKKETSYYPWSSAIRAFNDLSSKIGDESVLETHINARIRDLLETVTKDKSISSNNWGSESHVDGIKLQMIWDVACKVGHQQCVLETQQLFANYKTNNVYINPNIQNVVYCNALRYTSDPSDWSFLWNKYLLANNPQESINILSAFGCSRNVNQLQSLLEQTMDPLIIRPQDVAEVWYSVYTNSEIGLDTAFNYFLNNYPAILEKTSNALEIFSSIASRVSTTRHVQQLEEFGNQQPVTPIVQVAQAALVIAKQNIVWQERVVSDLKSYFNIPEPENTGSSAISLFKVSVTIILPIILFVLY